MYYHYNPAAVAPFRDAVPHRIDLVMWTPDSITNDNNSICLVTTPRGGRIHREPDAGRRPDSFNHSDITDMIYTLVSPKLDRTHPPARLDNNPSGAYPMKCVHRTHPVFSFRGGTSARLLRGFPGIFTVLSKLISLKRCSVGSGAVFLQRFRVQSTFRLIFIPL
jgi:hypothetical protein